MSVGVAPDVRSLGPGPSGEASEQVIGRSLEGRPLRVRFAGRRSAPLRVVVMAGQHGDEPGARQSAARFLEGFVSDPPAELRDRVRIAVLEDANPDGAARGSRRNAEGRDLNRDHLELTSCETRAVHAWIRSFRPTAVLDVHNYPSRRRHLVARGRILDTDVLLGFPTHPAARAPGRWTNILDRARADLAQGGYTLGPYLLFQRSGRVRLSTLQTVDARNGLALRYGIPTVLVEGRAPRPGEGDSERERLVDAQALAIRALVGSHVAHAEEWEAPPGEGAPRVAVRARWTGGGAQVGSWVRAAESAAPVLGEVPEALTRAQVTQSVRIPDAYAVPRRWVPLLEILTRQGFPEWVGEPPATVTVESYEFVAARAGAEAELRPVASGPAGEPLDSYRIFPTIPPGGPALGAWLEPNSQFGLAGRSELGLRRAPGSSYPVLRLHWGT